jgi:hypothetical protein
MIFFAIMTDVLICSFVIVFLFFIYMCFPVGSHPPPTIDFSMTNRYVSMTNRYFAITNRCFSITNRYCAMTDRL